MVDRCLLYEKAKIYRSLLIKWQAKVNLVSNSSLDCFWQRHFEDSLQLLPLVRGSRVLDIGSGAGFPGMVLAMTGEFSVTCVDSDNRKMIFLSEVARVTDTDVEVVVSRIENFCPQKFDTVCARGFAPLIDLIPLVRKFSGYGLFLKGKNYHKEIDDALRVYDFDYDVVPSSVCLDGVVLVVSTDHKAVKV